MSGLSHEERLQERNELLTRLNPDQIAFIKSFRGKKSRGISGNVGEKVNEEIIKMETENSIRTEQNIVNKPLVTQNNNVNEIELRELYTEFSESKMQVENVEINDKEKAEVSESSLKYKDDKLSKESIDEEIKVDLPIPIDEAKKWIHMDKVKIHSLKQGWHSKTHVGFWVIVFLAFSDWIFIMICICFLL